MPWINNDGLLVRFGTEEAIVGRGGQIRAAGSLEVVELKVNLIDVATTNTILSDTLKLPKGARLESCEIVNETAATSGGVPTLDIGLIAEDRVTVTNATALSAGTLYASMQAPVGRVNTLKVGSTGAGALLGTTTAVANLICAKWNTAAFTGGKIVVRVSYYIA